jgi:hypothetical protein
MDALLQRSHGHTTTSYDLRTLHGDGDGIGTTEWRIGTMGVVMALVQLSRGARDPVRDPSLRLCFMYLRGLRPQTPLLSSA